jgi:hypothetical protein
MREEPRSGRESLEGLIEARLSERMKVRGDLEVGGTREESSGCDDAY